MAPISTEKEKLQMANQEMIATQALEMSVTV
jgi:hypothetical protein